MLVAAPGVLDRTGVVRRPIILSIRKIKTTFTDSVSFAPWDSSEQGWNGGRPSEF